MSAINAHAVTDVRKELKLEQFKGKITSKTDLVMHHNGEISYQGFPAHEKSRHHIFRGYVVVQHLLDDEGQSKMYKKYFVNIKDLDFTLFQQILYCLDFDGLWLVFDVAREKEGLTCLTWARSIGTKGG